ncbi:MAG: hypothetical protein F4X83_00145 [Chloroflexi bacterium]|nr:hypothetical protein [Chloroflexota bacterium]
MSFNEDERIARLEKAMDEAWKRLSRSTTFLALAVIFGCVAVVFGGANLPGIASGFAIGVWTLNLSGRWREYRSAEQKFLERP